MCAQSIKLRMLAQERFDLPDFNNFQDLIESDFQLQQKGLFSGSATYIVQGFVVSHPGLLQISVAIANSVVLNGANNGSLYVAPSGTAPITDVATDGATTYFWLELGTQDTTPTTRTFWDPSLNNGLGGEFDQVINTHQELTVTLHKNNIGFPVQPNLIPVCSVVAVAGNITTFVDSRPMLYRLGAGGSAPSINTVYTWPAGRPEPGNSGGTPAVFTGGDKQLASLKDAFNAITSVIKEIKFGSATGAGAVWYAPAPSTLSDQNLAMTGGGFFNWNLGANALSFTADVTFLIPSTAFTNTINQAASSPIIMNANDQVVYVDINRGANAVLVPITVASNAFVPQVDRILIARRIANVAYVGLD